MLIKNNLIKFIPLNPQLSLWSKGKSKAVKAVPIKQHIKIKRTHKRKRKTNSANRYRSMIKQLGYTEEQIYKILLAHKHQHTGKQTKHHRRRKSKHLKNQVHKEVANRNGLSLNEIVGKHSISRMTLYRWIKQWKSNKYSGYYSSVFDKTKHKGR